MMLYDVLCLKSILGFLLSERTSGVSPVIFYNFILNSLKPEFRTVVRRPVLSDNPQPRLQPKMVRGSFHILEASHYLTEVSWGPSSPSAAVKR